MGSMTTSSIVIDSSALIAIFFGEPEADTFARLIRESNGHISASNVYETEVVVLRRMGPDKVHRVRDFLTRGHVTIHAFDDSQAQEAAKVYAEFGKGCHPAGLNLMDCAAHALAKSLDASLLYKGNDFTQTDIVSAVTPG
jgi:ribonuclease VapC